VLKQRGFFLLMFWVDVTFVRSSLDVLGMITEIEVYTGLRAVENC
jgi:hypothetical protein